MSVGSKKWKVVTSASADYSLNVLELVSVNFQSGSVFIHDGETNRGYTLQYSGFGAGGGAGITLPLSYTGSLPWDYGSGSRIYSVHATALTPESFEGYIAMLGGNITGSTGAAISDLAFLRTLDINSVFARAKVWGNSKGAPNVGLSGYLTRITARLDSFIWYGLDISEQLGYGPNLANPPLANGKAANGQ